MTSRERVTKAINHQVPDRVPVDLGGMKASTIAAIAYDKVKSQLGMTTPTRVIDARFMIAALEDDVLKRLHADVVPLDLSCALPMSRPQGEWIPRQLFDGTNVLFPPDTRIGEDAAGNWLLLNEDGSPTTFQMPKGGYYFDDVSFNQGDRIDPKKFRPVSDISDEHLALLQKYGRSLYRNTDYAILGWGFGICFLGLSLITDRTSNVTQALTDEWMMMLMTEKETCHEMMDQSVDASIKCLKLAHEAVGDCCFAWGVAADDSGTQRGEFIRPELWAEMLKPHYKRLCDWIHANTPWKVFLHSCGSIYNLLPHFIEAGIDILNPVQTSAANMDPARLKKEFGDRLVFWGGIGTQTTMPFAAPDEVYRAVQRTIDVLGPTGFFPCPTHVLEPEVKWENILAYLQAVEEYRFR